MGNWEKKKIAEYPSGILMVPPATQRAGPGSLLSAGSNNKEPQTPINLFLHGRERPARVLRTGLGRAPRPAGSDPGPGVLTHRALSGPIKIINFSRLALERQTREHIPVIYNLAVLFLMQRSERAYPVVEGNELTYPSTRVPELGSGRRGSQQRALGCCGGSGWGLPCQPKPESPGPSP